MSLQLYIKLHILPYARVYVRARNARIHVRVRHILVEL